MAHGPKHARNNDHKLRPLLFVLTVVALSSASVVAYATNTVTRSGSDYSGIRNPGGCEVMPEHGSDLHVKCTKGVGAYGPAFVRYRFLNDVGGVREDAQVSADVTTWIGDTCFIEWMVPAPRVAARTARITVPEGSYCHIHSVTWSQ